MTRSYASTFLLPLVLAGFGINVALFSCVAVLIIGGLVCWLWAPETRRESLVTSTGPPTSSTQ